MAMVGNNGGEQLSVKWKSSQKLGTLSEKWFITKRRSKLAYSTSSFLTSQIYVLLHIFSECSMYTYA